LFFRACRTITKKRPRTCGKDTTIIDQTMHLKATMLGISPNLMEPLIQPFGQTLEIVYVLPITWWDHDTWYAMEKLGIKSGTLLERDPVEFHLPSNGNMTPILTVPGHRAAALDGEIWDRWGETYRDHPFTGVLPTKNGNRWTSAFGNRFTSKIWNGHRNCF